MKEVICINLGQSGVQLSNASWELFCCEHGIQANGLLRESLLDDDSTAFKTFFQEVPTGQFVPRTVSIDLEPTVLDEVRTGVYRNLFHPDQLISGYEDAANNFARGHFTVGKTMIDPAMSIIRRSVECCDRLQNFFLLNSICGGTGSGYTSLLLEHLAVEYSNRYRVLLSLSISPVLSTSVVEPYNAILMTHSSMEFTDIAVLNDNEALYAICRDSLDITRPTYANLNRVIARNFSDLTVSIRFESSLSSDIDQLATNLIPYPRIHFPIMAHAPNVSESRAKHQSLGTAAITRLVFGRNCMLVTCDPTVGKYMSCCMQFRGDVTTKDVNLSLHEIRRHSNLSFVDWCPTGFKVGINSQPPVSVSATESAQVSRAVSMLTNTSAISQAWHVINGKFDALFQKRAFVHWYVGEGMEEGELNEACNDLICLVADYDEVCGVEFESVATPSLTNQLTRPPSSRRVSSEDNEIIPLGMSEGSTKFLGVHSGKSKSDIEKEKEEEEDTEDEEEDSNKSDISFSESSS